MFCLRVAAAVVVVVVVVVLNSYWQPVMLIENNSRIPYNRIVPIEIVQ